MTTSGVSKTVSLTAPQDFSTTGYDMCNLVASRCWRQALIAGELWDAAGPRGTFLAGATFAAFPVFALLWVRRSQA